MLQIEDPRPAFLRRLNSRQLEAATAPTDVPLLIFAGPGSGKTLTIICRIAYLLHCGTDPRRILALTFSRKSAEEMRSRCLQYTKEQHRFDPDFLTICTFHSFALKVLRYNYEEAGLQQEFKVMSTYHQRTAVEKCVLDYIRTRPIESLFENEDEGAEEEMQGLMDNGEEEVTVVSGNRQIVDKKAVLRVQAIIQRAKLLNSVSSLSRPQRQVYDSYQSSLRLSNSIDYGDMLLMVVQLWRSQPAILQQYSAQFQYILCDEFQDTNEMQLDLLEMLSRNHGRITVCGDDDQAIYGWRGATQHAFLKFADLFPTHTKVVLTENYRSTQRVVELTQKLIGFNKVRTVKSLFTFNAEGPKAKVLIASNPVQEARMVVDALEQMRTTHHLSYCEIAILVRLNRSGFAVEKELTKRHIPLVTSAKASRSIWQNSDILNLIAYMRLCLDPNNNDAFGRVYNVPKRGIGKAKYAKLTEVSIERKISQFSAAKIIMETDESLGKVIKPLVSLISELKDFAAEHDSVSVFKRILETTQYEVKADTEAIDAFEHKLMVFSAVLSRNRLTDFLLALDLGELDGQAKDYVTLSSIHQAKGLEWEVVFITKMNEGHCPSYAHADMEDRGKEHMEEERRLAYVAATRSRKHLFLSYSLQDDQGSPMIPSRFIEEFAPTALEVLPSDSDVSPPQDPKYPSAGKTKSSPSSSISPKRIKLQLPSNIT